MKVRLMPNRLSYALPTLGSNLTLNLLIQGTCKCNCISIEPNSTMCDRVRLFVPNTCPTLAILLLSLDHRLIY